MSSKESEGNKEAPAPSLMVTLAESEQEQAPSVFLPFKYQKMAQRELYQQWQADVGAEAMKILRSKFGKEKVLRNAASH